MKVAAITITYNRLELTKRTIESFYDKTSVDYHLFVDNGSTDGTLEWLQDREVVSYSDNKGISFAFREAVFKLKDYDLILKLDNDVETITEDIIQKMVDFYIANGSKYIISPVDLNLDPKFAPAIFGKANLNGFNASLTTHTGGAFQMAPYHICQRMCMEYNHLKCGDFMIGRYYRRHGYRPAYLLDFKMRHIGINQSCGNYIL